MIASPDKIQLARALLEKTAFAPMAPQPPPQPAPQIDPQQMMQIMSQPDVQQALQQQGIQVTPQGPMANGQPIDPNSMAQILQQMGLMPGGQQGQPPPGGDPNAGGVPPGAPPPGVPPAGAPPMDPNVAAGMPPPGAPPAPPMPQGTPLTVESLVQVFPALMAQYEQAKTEGAQNASGSDTQAQLEDMQKMLFAIADKVGMTPAEMGMAPGEAGAAPGPGSAPPEGGTPEDQQLGAGLTDTAMQASQGQIPPEAQADAEAMAAIQAGPGGAAPEPGMAPPGPPAPPQGMQVQAMERPAPRPVSRIRALMSRMSNTQN